MTKKTTTLRKAALCAGLAFVSPQAQADETAFEKDRAAILAMAGKFEVTFNFHETYTTAGSYEIKEKKYSEKAHELVKVIEDDGKRIVLQHLLQVENGEGTMVVKHWGQVWTYEDTGILEYQGGTAWKNKTLSAADAKGTWSQYVTQTDDSPRYESHGTWDHSGGTSQWVSAPTNRPLPRREYKVRKDYDLIVGVNTHAITPKGWIHEQSNRKLVKRDGKLQYLCHERGFNTYFRVPEHDFSVAEAYWKKHSPFWKAVRAFWTKRIAASADVSYTRKINGKSMGKAVSLLIGDEGTPDKPEAVPATLAPYLGTGS